MVDFGSPTTLERSVLNGIRFGDEMDAQCGLLHVYTVYLREDLQWILLNGNHIPTER